MQNTVHYNLRKYDAIDRGDRTVINGNMDILDTVLYENEQKTDAAVANQADAYDDTETYAVGDLVIHGNALYECTTAITTAEAWNAAHWQQTTLAEQIAAGGGGGGGGTTVVANPVGEPTNDLNTIQIGGTIYDIPGGGGTGGAYTCDLLLENDDFTVASGFDTVTKSYTFAKSIDDYDAVLVIGYLFNDSSSREQLQSLLVLNEEYYVDPANNWTYLLNGSISSGNRRLAFKFPDSTHITTFASRNTGEEPVLYKVYGLKFGVGTNVQPAVHYSTEEQVIGTWIDGKTLYERTVVISAMPDTPFQLVTYAHNIADIDEICMWNGYMKYASGTTQQIPSVQFSSSAMTTQASAFAQIDKTNISVMVGLDRSAVTGTFVMRYTKRS